MPLAGKNQEIVLWVKDLNCNKKLLARLKHSTWNIEQFVPLAARKFRNIRERENQHASLIGDGNNPLLQRQIYEHG